MGWSYASCSSFLYSNTVCGVCVCLCVSVLWASASDFRQHTHTHTHTHKTVAPPQLDSILGTKVYPWLVCIEASVMDWAYATCLFFFIEPAQHLFFVVVVLSNLFRVTQVSSLATREKKRKRGAPTTIVRLYKDSIKALSRTLKAQIAWRQTNSNLALVNLNWAVNQVRLRSLRLY
jgi:hypothetical protein